jgi:hypothetical protein
MTSENDTQELELAKAGEMLLDECRMVLPGIQALFGFQLVAVFSERFASLPEHAQRLHIAAIALVALAVSMIMTPAAFHRQRDPRQVDAAFIHVSTTMLLASMLPLALALAIDLYVVAGTVTGEPIAAAIGSALLAFAAVLWFALPRSPALQRLLRFHRKQR